MFLVHMGVWWMCDGHPWFKTKTTDIQNNFRHFFRRSPYAGHLQCTNTYCDYLYRNGGVHNYTKWIGSTHIPFHVRDVAPEKSGLECMVGCLILVCVALCYVCILYVHSISPEMSKACIHLCAHEHPVSNDTCCESLDMVYQWDHENTEGS